MTRNASLTVLALSLGFSPAFSAQTPEDQSKGATESVEQAASQAGTLAKDAAAQLQSSQAKAQQSQAQTPLRTEGPVAILEETETGKTQADAALVDDSYYNSVLDRASFPLGGSVTYSCEIRTVTQKVQILDRKAYRDQLVQRVKETSGWERRDVKAAKKMADATPDIFTREARYISFPFQPAPYDHYIRYGISPDVAIYLVQKK